LDWTLIVFFRIGYTGFQEMDAGYFQDRIGNLVGSGFRLDFFRIGFDAGFGFVGFLRIRNLKRLDVDSTLDFQDLDLEGWIWIRLLSLGYWRRS